MSYRRKMWTTGIDCAKFAFGIRLLQGPEIERDGDCIVTACLSQVLSDIWSLSVIINNDMVNVKNVFLLCKGLKSPAIKGLSELSYD